MAAAKFRFRKESMGIGVTSRHSTNEYFFTGDYPLAKLPEKVRIAGQETKC